MRKAHAKGVLSVCSIVIFVLVAGFILYSKSDVAWNSEARGHLAEAVRHIGIALKTPGRDLPFIPTLEQSECSPHERTKWLSQYGVLLRWHDGDGYKETLFYPIALSSDIILEEDRVAPLSPQVVMVPIDRSDRLTVPFLSPCSDEVTIDELEDCQKSQIEKRFRSKNIQDATTLMSDGSVRHLALQDLFASSGTKTPKRKKD